MNSSSWRQWMSQRSLPAQGTRPIRQHRSPWLWDGCEPRKLLSVTINDVTMIEPPTEAESAHAVFKVSLDQPHKNETVSVDFRSDDATLQAGKDYKAVRGTLSFAPGEISKEISVPIIGGLARKPHDAFTVTLSNPVNDTIHPSLKVGLGTILPTPWLTISDVDVIKGESGANAEFKVTLNPPNRDQIVTVEYATADGSARAGIDYKETRGTLTFAPGETSKSIVVPINSGDTVEPTESFTVKLTSPVNAVVRDREGIGTISNPIKAGTIQFASPEIRIDPAPDTKTATVTVTRTEGSASGVGIDYATTGGSAIPGRDYTPVSGTLRFAADQTSQTFTIPLTIHANSDRKQDLTIEVALSHPSGGGLLGSASHATLTIAAPRPSTSEAPSTTPVAPPPESSTPEPPPLGEPAPTGSTTPEPGTETEQEETGESPQPQPDQVDPISVSSTVVTTMEDDGPGSLRQAIWNANANPGLDTITFRIPGAGLHSIRPRSELPTITDPVIIDGTAQLESHTTPVIELNGTLAGARSNGLTITAGGSTIRGLAINGFAGSGVRIQGAGGNRVVGNVIGTSADGETAIGNGEAGIHIDGSAKNTIGGSEPGSNGGNLISGNFGPGIILSGSASQANLVQGNHIGTDARGDDPLGNQLDGIVLDNAPGNRIGGASSGQGNLISGNQLTGIRLQGPRASGNVIEGNEIGTDWSGTRAIGNRFDGIFNDGAPDNTIGGTTTGSGNLISGNGGVGVQLHSRTATGNQVRGNLIGTDAQGAVAIGNQHGGVYLNNARGNTIGGASAEARNVISGNNLVGVQLAGRATTGNAIQGNFIGPDILGAPRLGNTVGLFVGGTHGNTIGGAGARANSIAGNLRADLALNPIPTSNANPGRPARAATSSITEITPSLAGADLTSLVVKFSQPTDPSRAEEIANYRLRLPGRNLRFDTADAVPVPIRSASYDPATTSVTLTLATPLRSASPLQFRVRGQASRGITSLAGTNGPGSDYVSILRHNS